MLREAMGVVADGSAEAKALGALSQEFKQVLLKFQAQVEATAYLVNPAAATGGGGGGAAGPSAWSPPC